MTAHDLHQGDIIDDITLTLDQLATACKVESTWIIERVRDDIFNKPADPFTEWRFTSAELVRARRLIGIEKGFDANPELAALVVDLMEELDAARRQLKAAGIV